MQKLSIPKVSVKKDSTLEDVLTTQSENLAARLGAVEAPVDDRGFLGKLLNLEQNQNFFFDVLEVLDRPGQAVKGFIAPTEDDDPLTGFFKGLSGQTDRSGIETLVDLDAINESDIEVMSGVEQFAINFGFDMLTDPLTYLPAGSIKKLLDKLNPFEIEDTYKAILAGTAQVKTAKQAQLDDLVKTMTAANPRKKAATILKEAKKQLGIIDATTVQKAVKQKKKLIESARKKIADLKAKGLTDKQIAQLSENAGGLGWRDWEAIAIDDINKKLAQTAADLKVTGSDIVVTSTSKASAPGTYDLDILLDLGDDTFATVSRVQIKSTAKGAARGASTVLKGSKAGVIQFADNVKMTPEIQKLVQTKYSGITVSVTRDGKQTTATVAEVIDDLINPDVAGKSLTFSSKNVSQKDFDILQEAAKDIMNAQYAADDFVYIIGKDGVGDLFRWGDLQDNIKYTVGVQTSPSAKGKGPMQTRLQIGVDLDRLPVEKSAMDSLADEVFNVTKIDSTRKIKVGFFDWAAQEKRDGKLLNTFAKRVVKFKENVGRNFNAFFQVGEDTTAAYRRLTAESQNIVADNGRRLTILSEEALRRSPNANAIIQELMETGARVVDGKVIVDTTYMSMDNLLELYTTGWIKAGQDGIPLVVYGPDAARKGITARNIATKLNDAVRRASGIDDAFKVVAKGDDFVLTLDNISVDDLARLRKDSQFAAIINERQYKNLSLGRKRLTDEQLNFYLENEDLVDSYRRIDAEINDIYNKELGIQNIPGAIKTTNGYVRHTLSRQGAEWLKANQPLAYSKYMREGIDFLAQRKYLGTVDDINRVMKTMYDIDFDFFQADAANSLADLLRVGVTKNESGRVLQLVLQGSDDADRPLFQIVDNVQQASLGDRYEYITDFQAEYSKLYENLAPDAQRVLENYFVANGMDSTKAIAIHKSGHAMLKRIEKAYVEVPQLLKEYDNILNMWKSLNLVTPTFHINNFFGNSINSFLVGMGVVDQSRYLTRASSHLRQYQRILKQLDTAILSGTSRVDAIAALSKTDQQIYDVLLGYLTSGTSMKGRGVRDLGAIGKTLEEGGQTGLYRQLLEANFNLSENADELQRLALFMWAYDKEIGKLGGVIDDVARQGARTKASNLVFESMFDYTHFTQFERDVMKRMIPFYTFMKNNLVFQMRNIINNPSQYNKLGRAYKYYVSDIAGLTEDDMPDYARNNMWLPIPITVERGDKETITFLKANLPPAEFGELIESRFARGVSSLTIPLKLPIELALNRDIFTGAEIKEFAGQKDRMEPGTGVASFMRDEQGMAVLSADPTIQKIVNDLGGRVPARYISTALGIADAAAGYKDPEDAFFEALNSLGVLSIKDKEDVRITNLYQAIERYRDAEKRWEQGAGIDLPSKKDLGLK